jgi:hypothetical protein
LKQAILPSASDKRGGQKAAESPFQRACRVFFESGRILKWSHQVHLDGSTSETGLGKADGDWVNEFDIKGRCTVGIFQIHRGMFDCL